PSPPSDRSCCPLPTALTPTPRSTACLSRPPPVSTLFPYTTLFRSTEEGIYVLRVISRTPADSAEFVKGVDEYRARQIQAARQDRDRKSTRLNSSHVKISYAVFCLKKKNSRDRARERARAARVEGGA